MNLHEELIERSARRRSAKLGGLTPAAYAELVLAVREHPQDYIDDPSDQAFLEVSQGVGRVLLSRADDELRDDDAFMEERQRRMQRLEQDCAHALETCRTSVHARLVTTLAADWEPDDQLDALLALEREVEVIVYDVCRLALKFPSLCSSSVF